ncbi:hypothetical protein [Frankia sp. CiP3]|uniref:hypothetical protein n=1 Tax=Frankia sp. CiP3 TaxID=2880971 RepID=UPI001EF722D6|nr:hypothetical protein [Frankia sp. CiP3]
MMRVGADASVAGVFDACGTGLGARFGGGRVTGCVGIDFAELVSDFLATTTLLTADGPVNSAEPLRAAVRRLLGDGVLIVVVHPGWRAAHRTLMAEALAPLGVPVRQVPEWYAVLRAIPDLDDAADGTEVLVTSVGTRKTRLWQVQKIDDVWHDTAALTTGVGVASVAHAVTDAVAPEPSEETLRALIEGGAVDLRGETRTAAFRAFDGAATDLADAVGDLFDRVPRSAAGSAVIVLTGPGASLTAVRREVEDRTRSAPVPLACPEAWAALYGAARRWATALGTPVQESRTFPAFTMENLIC